MKVSFVICVKNLRQNHIRMNTLGFVSCVFTCFVCFFVPVLCPAFGFLPVVHGVVERRRRRRRRWRGRWRCGGVSGGGPAGSGTVAGGPAAVVETTCSVAPSLSCRSGRPRRRLSAVSSTCGTPTAILSVCLFPEPPNHCLPFLVPNNLNTKVSNDRT